MNLQPTGKVILAGAGPGDEGLITVKLQKRLAVADIIITDRLVNPLIIDLYTSQTALIVFAGKEGYNDSSSSQEEVTTLIIKYALEGRTVLRLKGGDIAFFSNALDELMALQRYKIPFEIIPGITAASGASSYAGIPLTARGYAQSVQFLTYNPNSFYSTEKWRSLSNSNDTLVFYMASKNIKSLAELLLRFTKRPLTPLVVIEQATTPYQQLHFSTLKNCEVDFKEKDFSSPSLIIIGDVVKLHQSFNWFTAESKGSVFNELITAK